MWILSLRHSLPRDGTALVPQWLERRDGPVKSFRKKIKRLSHPADLSHINWSSAKQLFTEALYSKSKLNTSTDFHTEDAFDGVDGNRFSPKALHWHQQPVLTQFWGTAFQKRLEIGLYLVLYTWMLCLSPKPQGKERTWGACHSESTITHVPTHLVLPAWLLFNPASSQS